MHWLDDTSSSLCDTFDKFLRSLRDEEREEGEEGEEPINWRRVAAVLEKTFLKCQVAEQSRMQRSSLSFLFEDAPSSWKLPLDLDEPSDCKSVFDLDPLLVADHLSAICFLLHYLLKPKDVASWCFKTSQTEIQV